MQEIDMERDLPETPESQRNLPLYQPPVRRDSKSTQASRRTQDTHRTQASQRTKASLDTKVSLESRLSHRSNSSRSTAPKPRPPLLPQDSNSTLVGSAYERKINDVDSVKEKVDTSDRLEQMRTYMLKDNLDF